MAAVRNLEFISNVFKYVNNKLFTKVRARARVCVSLVWVSESHRGYLWVGTETEKILSINYIIQQAEYVLCEERAEAEETVDLRAYNKT
jgi:hypothetical protein